jgi:hypothetical protein
MNSLDENYAPAVLLPAVLNIFVLPQTVPLFSQLRVKIFNRLNSKKHLNLPNSIFTEYKKGTYKNSGITEKNK